MGPGSKTAKGWKRWPRCGAPGTVQGGHELFRHRLLKDVRAELSQQRVLPLQRLDLRGQEGIVT
jgi:hypothetical protein